MCNRPSRHGSGLVATSLLLMILAFSALAESSGAPSLSVMNVPPIQGSNQGQLAVRWSGALPAQLQAGVDQGAAGFLPLGQPIALREAMSLLPRPTETEVGDVRWRVLDEQGQTLAEASIEARPAGWQPTFKGPGVDGQVRAALLFEGDLVVAGDFQAAGRHAVNNIVRWDGSEWKPLAGPLGVGTDGSVSALTLYDGELIVGGDFTHAGGVRVNGIARWDGSVWSALEGASGTGVSIPRVAALTEYGGALIVGGRFTGAGGLQANGIARWDGSDWSVLSGSAGTGVEGVVYAFTVFEGSLVVGGGFRAAGGVISNNVALWDGDDWSELAGLSGTGVSDVVTALTVYDEALIVGGYFLFAGGAGADRVARWDGSNWSALAVFGSGPSGAVKALIEHEGELFVAGSFARAGGVTVNNIARWDGSDWNALGGPTGTGWGGEVMFLTSYEETLIVGGQAQSAGGIFARGIARWDGTIWSALDDFSGTGLSDAVTAVTVYDGALIAGGGFIHAGGTIANRVARWDGSAWSALGSGLDGPVNALVVYNGELIVGGRFNTAGGVAADNIARWDGNRWSALEGPSGAGANFSVHALLEFDGALMVGGSFSVAGGVPSRGIARWDGGAWSEPGASGMGVDGRVFALAEYDGGLIAGGNFFTAGGVEARHIARWDGSEWAALLGTSGANVNATVRSLGVFDGALFVGGGFSFSTSSGATASNIARWDGSEWSALLGSSGMSVDGEVFALTEYEGALIAGGWFARADAMQANGIARWDGSSWSVLAGPFGVGVAGHVEALTEYDGALIAGGMFMSAAGVPSWRLAEYRYGHTIGGTLTGLAEGTSVVLQNNGGDDLALDSNGSFTFPLALLDGSPYAVTIVAGSVEPAQSCSVSDAVGTLADVDVTDIEVHCVTLYEPGLSGLWFNSDRDGEGFSIEVLDGGVVLVVWYTYDTDGGQMWLIGTGLIEEDVLRVDELLRPLGARFGDEFDPGDVQRLPWGSLQIAFENCNSAWFDYQGPEGYGEVSYSLQRLAQMSGTGCGSSMRNVNSSYSGMFYDPDRDGEGFSIQVVDDMGGGTRSIGFWFTYTADGGQAWLIGSGERNSSSYFLAADVLQPQGARFGADFNPNDVQRVPWGVWLVEHSDCNTASLSYVAIESDLDLGEGSLKRLTRPGRVDCPAP